MRRHTSRYFKLPEPEDASDDEPGGAAAGPHQPSRNLSLLAAVATRATQKSMHEVVDEAVVKSQGEARRQPTTDKVQLPSHRLSSVDHDTSDNETQEDNVDVTCGVVGVPYLMMGTGPHANIFPALVKASEKELDLITCDVMRAAIAFKWQTYGHSRWVMQVVTFTTFFVCYLISLFLLLARKTPVALPDFFFAEDAPHLQFGGVLFLIATLINWQYGLQELHEVQSSGPREYFASAQNWFDCACFLNVGLVFLLIVSGSDLARTFGALGTVLLLPKVGAVVRGHEKMSALCTMLFEIISDMVPFLSLMAFVILVNTFSFELLSSPDSEEYGTFARSWMSAYALTLGEFSVDTYEESLLIACFYHYYTVFVNIVLLNVLIAIISDTYERVEEKSKARGLLMRARILLEMQDSMTDEMLADEVMFPKWLHVIMRVEDVGSADIWSGRLHAIKEHITTMEKKVDETEVRIIHEVKQMGESHQRDMAEFSRKIWNAVSAIQKQQEDLLRAVRALEPPTASDVTLLAAPPKPLRLDGAIGPPDSAVNSGLGSVDSVANS